MINFQRKTKNTKFLLYLQQEVFNDMFDDPLDPFFSIKNPAFNRVFSSQKKYS